MITPEQSVASVVLEHPECAAVFQRRRIDSCCRGDLSVQTASEQAGVAPAALLEELATAIAERGGRTPDPRELSTPALVAHLVSSHHRHVREALPFLGGLAAKVSRVHGEHNPRLREVQAGLAELTELLLPHLDEEEQALFPLLIAGGADRARARRQLDAMHEEHLEVGALLGRVRAAAEDFALPDWACNSYRTLYAELEQLEGEVRALVHLENHVLRPRFTA